MARNMNVVCLTGNLTREPELRNLPSGTSVCELGLAVNESYKDKASGEWKERANYFTITVWGGQGEACAQYLSKGRPVAVTGSLRYESWTNNDGDKRSAVKVVAFPGGVQFLNARSGDGGGGGGGNDGQGSFSPEPEVPADTADLSGGAAPATAHAGAGSDDDIPF